MALVAPQGKQPNNQERGNVCNVMQNFHIALSAHLCYRTFSTRVSNELGAGNPEVAKLAVRVVVTIVIAEGLLIGLVLLLMRHKLGYVFSSDPKVIKYVASMIPIVATGNFLDGLQCVLSGS